MGPGGKRSRQRPGSPVKLFLQLPTIPPPLPPLASHVSLSLTATVPHPHCPAGMCAGPHARRLGHVRAAAAQPGQACDAARGGRPATRLPEPGGAVPGNAAGRSAVCGPYPPGPHSTRHPRACSAGLSLAPARPRGTGGRGGGGAALKASCSHLPRQPLSEYCTCSGGGPQEGVGCALSRTVKEGRE